MKKLIGTLGAALALTLAGPVATQAQADVDYSAVIGTLNGSGASGVAELSLNGNMLTVQIRTTGLLPNAPHAQHIHVGGANVCPGRTADTDGDGVISTPEGVPSYGMVQVSLTTSGDVSADSAVAVDRMPVADRNGVVEYSRTFMLPAGVTATDVMNGVIVQHGVDLNGSGMYDGSQMSPLAPSLPLEATAPAACGRIIAAASAPATTAPPPVAPAPRTPAPIAPAPAPAKAPAQAPFQAPGQAPAQFPGKAGAAPAQMPWG